MTVTTLIALVVLNRGKRFIKEKVEVSTEDDIVVGH
jgi:DHA1 family bicyclomycin/chloramphenicol resistance-like MFS transporter